MNIWLLGELTKTNFVPVYHFTNDLPKTSGRKSLYCLHPVGFYAKAGQATRYEYGSFSWTEFKIIDFKYIFTSKSKFKNFKLRWKEWEEDNQRRERIHKDAENKSRYHRHR